MHSVRVAIAASACLALFGMCGTAACQDASASAEMALNSLPAIYGTTVAKQPGEDLAGPCSYSLYLTQPTSPVRGVLVIFDRADSNLLYGDPSIRGLVHDLNLALLFPLQCNAASFNDIQPDAMKGPGRALFAALAQFAVSTRHPELKGANVLLYGFSAGGILSTTLANYEPSRVIGVIGYAAASPGEKLDWIVASAATLQIPFLLLSNADDPQAGTRHDELFFQRGWASGAPWAWAVQNKTGHCCNLSTVPIILPWIKAIVGLRLASTGGLLPIRQTGVGSERFVTFTCTVNGQYDNTANENCSFTAEALRPANTSRSSALGWLPDDATAEEWLKWTTN